MSEDEQDWVDVTTVLACASERLKVGEMLQAEGFTLFEAMNAVEIGNPKMDAGITNSQPLTPEELAAEGAAPLHLTHSQLLSVMDHLLCLETAWHLGNSLAQTLFSSLYLLLPERTEASLLLSAYCKCLKATCQQVRCIVYNGCVCEEEDVNVYASGLPLETEFVAPDEKFLASMSLALDQLSGADGEAQMASLSLSDAAAGDISPQAAIAARLRFRKQLYLALSKLQLRTREAVEAAGHHAARALADLEVMQLSQNLAGEEIIGIAANVNAHLLAPTPPREVQVFSKAEMWKYFDTFLKQLQQACRVTTCQQYEELRSFLVSFSSSTPAPVAVTRSALHLMVKCAVDDEGPPWAPRAAMLRAATGAPAGRGPHADVDLFFEQAHIAVGNWCQAVLLNRPRQRRRLRRILDDQANLYQHGLQADNEVTFRDCMTGMGYRWPEAPPGEEVQALLGTWVVQETCRSLLQHLYLGMELELYSPGEYAMIYWYCDYLYTVLLQSLNSRVMLEPLPPAAGGTRHAGATPAGGGKKKGGKLAPPNSRVPVQSAAKAAAAAASHRVAVFACETLRLACQAFLRTSAALSKAGALPACELPFNTPAQRFEQRFGAFGVLVAPQPLFYDQLASSTDTTGISPARLMDMALDTFAQVQNGITILGREWANGNDGRWGKLEDYKALEQVVKRNSLALTIMKKSVDDTSKRTVSFDFSFHPHFPVLKLRGGK